MIPLAHWRHLVATSAPPLAGELAEALCLSAMSVGARIADGERYGVRQQEETITESVLIDLCRGIPRLRVRTLKRHEETAAGADWEWWIQGREMWFGFLVQAKRVHDLGRARKGYQLGYRPNPAADGSVRPLQIASLLESSDRLQVPAVYALYNQAGAGIQFTRPQFGSACVVPHGADGVTALGAWAARWLLLINDDPLAIDVGAIAPHAFPWSCLAFCLDDNRHGAWPALERDAVQQLGFPAGTDASDAALSAARFVLEIERSTRLNQFALATDAPAPDIERMAVAVRSAPPAYVPSSEGQGPEDMEGLEPLEHPLAERGMAPHYVASLGRDPRADQFRYLHGQGLAPDAPAGL